MADHVRMQFHSVAKIEAEDEWTLEQTQGDRPIFARRITVVSTNGLQFDLTLFSASTAALAIVCEGK